MSTNGTDTKPEAQPGSRTTDRRETFTIVTTIIMVGLTILGTLVYTTERLEDRLAARIDAVLAQAQAESKRLSDEAQADRAAWQAQAQTDRAAWQAEIDAVQAQAQADRAAWQAESRQLRDEARTDRENFQREILRLTAEQARLAAIAETPPRD